MILVAGFIMVAYIIALLTVNYLSQTNLKTAALERFQLDAEKRAIAISYFYSERSNDLKDLANSKELSTFFRNQALGMSMEYGLRASLLAITDLFNHLVKEKKINQDHIYQWIVFIESNGTVLASNQAGEQPPELTIDIKEILNPAATDPFIVANLQGGNQEILVTTPYFFKNQYLGQIIARIVAQNLYRHLISATAGGFRTWYICQDKETTCVSIAAPKANVIDPLPPILINMAIGKTQLLNIDITKEDGSDLTVEALAVKVPIQDTPFSLVTLAPATQIFGQLAPRHLLPAMGFLALLVLWGTIAVIRTNTLNLVLRARYDEASKQQTTLRLKNTQLQEEIAKRQEGEARLNHMAHHDSLTGLPNRMLFNDRLRHALQRAYRNGHQLAVLFLDLDRFKNVNDTLGHPVGDQLLKIVARRLGGCLREQDTLARLGGDEFIALMEGPLVSSQDVAAVAQRLLQTLARPFDLSNQEIFLTTSIGISFYPTDGQDVTELVKNADTAMYRAKEQGRNTYQFYTVELTTTAFERFALETSLRHALERGEFILYYQPLYSFKTDRIIGAEALIRWQHPQEGLVSPIKFIPVAEETGLIEPIGEWVMRTACAQAKAWRTAGRPPLRMAVNLSSRQIMSSRLLDQVRQALEDTRLEPQYLELEITESSIMSEPAKAIATLDALKDLGVSLVIDDFGTGYSSLSYLKRFNVSKLKIDRSFVCDLPEDANDRAIIRAIIALGHSMQLQISAEGVETGEQQAFLKAEGCDERQGYLLSKPVPADLFDTLLQGDKPLVVS